VNLPESLRNAMVEDLDKYLEAFGSDPDAEAVAATVADLLESWADDVGYDDEILVAAEESGELESPFVEALESEMASNDEFEFTGEEIVSLLERMLEIEWVGDEEFGDDELTEELDEP
jgi:threonine aldolase